MLLCLDCVFAPISAPTPFFRCNRKRPCWPALAAEQLTTQVNELPCVCTCSTRLCAYPAFRLNSFLSQQQERPCWPVLAAQQLTT